MVKAVNENARRRSPKNCAISARKYADRHIRPRFLGFCFVPAGHGLVVDVSSGLAGGLIATTSDNIFTLKLASPADTATLDSFFQIEGSQGDDDITGNDGPNFFDDCGGDDVFDELYAAKLTKSCAMSAQQIADFLLTYARPP